MIQEMIHVPFPGTPYPDVDILRQRVFEWFRSYGMLNADAAVQKHLSADIAGLGGSWYDAPVENILLPTCAPILAAMIDDQVDGALDRRPDLVAQLVNDLNSVMYTDPHVFSFPDAAVVQAFSGLWAGSAQGMSARWTAHLRSAWEQYYNAYIVETHNRFSGSMMKIDEYIPFRRESGYMYVGIAYLEQVQGFEVPPALRAMPQIRELHNICCDVISIANDIHSLEKEEKRGEIHNIAILLQHERHCSRHEAIDTTCKMIHEWCERFFVLENEIPVICQSFRLPEEITTAVQAHVTGLGKLIGGYCAWGRTTRRYHAYNATTADQPGFPESYL